MKSIISVLLITTTMMMTLVGSSAQNDGISGGNGYGHRGRDRPPPHFIHPCCQRPRGPADARRQRQDCRGPHWRDGCRYGPKENSGAWEDPQIRDSKRQHVETTTVSNPTSVISDDPRHVQFLLYNSPGNPNEFEILEFGNLTSVKSSKYDGKKPVKFLAHGFQQNYASSFPQNVKDAFLSKNGGEYNIIAVDWGRLSIPEIMVIAPSFYPFAVKNVYRVGSRLGEFILWLHSEQQISLDLVQIIGFSLGSHVSSRAAVVVKEKLGQKVARVTGLDPAGPEFYIGIFATKLTSDDAQFVDAMHTNAGQLGIWQQVGHVDFFVNGGSGPQPGCAGLDSVRVVADSVVHTVTGSCSHNKATEFFAKIILDGDVSIKACRSWLEYKASIFGCISSTVSFGQWTSPNSRGTYYLEYKV